MSAGIIIGILAFLGFLLFIGISIYNISSNTVCDSSKCISPGGTWIKDKCTCSCNPGYSGNNCQTKSKHVSDLETACKDKTGNACVSCLKNNISQKLSGNATDVQQFKDDFISSISSINNICCQNNCSNSSGTACDNCVSEKMNQLGHIKDDTAYFINNNGCFSFKTTNQPQNFIGKKNICNDKNTDPCFPDPCKNNSKCVVTNNTHKCVCNTSPPFFDGPTCNNPCREKAPKEDCGNIKGKSNCKYYYNSDNEKCEKTTLVFWDDCDSGDNINDSEKCK
tara:strand:- start:375 stop:1214 length:840 start_codon:yes stop_codon:yes gene_type:complete